MKIFVQLCSFVLPICNNISKQFLINFVVARNLSLVSSHFQKPKWGANKQRKKIKLNLYFNKMADSEDLEIKSMEDPKFEEALAELRANVKEEGDKVRKLKAEGAPELDVKKAVAEFKKCKKILDDLELVMAEETEFKRTRMEDLAKRRCFYIPSFSIYGGVSGLFDLGPMGCAFKANLLQAWRQFFVFEEQMLEVDCSILTPERVLKASGHVDKFADSLVKDVQTGECFRLDHIIKGYLERAPALKQLTKETKAEYKDILLKLDGMTQDEMYAIVKKYRLNSPPTGAELSEPMSFNLMFKINIGPTGTTKGFLRPETAQGIFVNFKRLLEFNQGKLPFAAAQIGNAFRNEISPRSSLLRVREFTMAEIEYFCDPSEKSHPKFENVRDVELLLYSACNQMDGKAAERTKIGEAVNEGLVANEALGYFMARIQQFLTKCGVDPERLRFRQHMATEMAHYARDCWDAECLTSYGWVECVGCADRSAYDLTRHTEHSGTKLCVEKVLPAPKMLRTVQLCANKATLGKTFNRYTKAIERVLEGYKLHEINAVEEKLNSDGVFSVDTDGKTFSLTKEHVIIKREEKKVYTEDITPNVIEPSFGVGRIMYVILEHNFKMRVYDEQRTYFALPPIVAPLKCSVLPLSSNAEFVPFVKILSADLRKADVTYKVDDSSGSIGRRYARTDEIAIPYGITIDFDTLKEPHSVTLRERDSMEQVRIPLNEIASIVHNLSYEKENWADIQKKYPKFEQQERKGVEKEDEKEAEKGVEKEVQKGVEKEVKN